MVRKKLDKGERFIIKYSLGTFSTFVEVLENWSCKIYKTEYDATTTTFTLYDLIDRAEEVALDLYLGDYYENK